MTIVDRFLKGVFSTTNHSRELGSYRSYTPPVGCQATNQRPAVTGGHRNLRVVTSRIVTVDNLRVDTCRSIRVHLIVKLAIILEFE